MTAKQITSFDGVFRFLSNFYHCRVKFDGVEYPSTEHAYQAAKTKDPAQRERIRLQTTCGKAKMLGKKVAMRPDWEAIKVDVMRNLLAQKFLPGSELAAKLLATDDAELIEGNTWGDTTWGCIKNASGEWVGQNLLGKLLMEQRQGLRS